MQSKMAETKRKPHGLMICFPYQGHINPFIGLALKLASHGFTITFVHFDFIHHKLAAAHSHSNNGGTGVDFFTGARRSGLDIRYAVINDPFPVEFDRDVNFEEYWETKLREFPSIADDFVATFIRSCHPLQPPTFLVTDTIYSAWSVSISKKYRLVNVSFWTEPALAFSLLYHLNLLGENGHFPCKDDMEEEINYLPGVKSINTRDLMPYLRASQSQGVTIKYLSISFHEVKGADFVLHNIVQELETGTLDALNKYQPNYAIGPINFIRNIPTNTVIKSLWSETDCSQWLQAKPPGSVLYISFGSVVNVVKQDIKEIAYALLLSEVEFILVVRDDLVSGSDSNVLPVGYEREIGDKGLIVPWCNQVMVLSSPAVGGFLTHCGWNSVSESMWCGVPMICYPLIHDQLVNRKLVVEDWKIGIDICDGKSVERKEVGENIRKVLIGETSKRLREEAKRVKTVLHNAMEVEGSSEKNFENFVRDLKAKICDDQ